jgi:hypothetical protein
MQRGSCPFSVSTLSTRWLEARFICLTPGKEGEAVVETLAMRVMPGCPVQWLLRKRDMLASLAALHMNLS